MASYGPGFRRMQKHLGPKRMEELRQDTIKRQTDARSAEAVTVTRDRDYYKDYPKPKRR